MRMVATAIAAALLVGSAAAGCGRQNEAGRAAAGPAAGEKEKAGPQGGEKPGDGRPAEAHGQKAGGGPEQQGTVTGLEQVEEGIGPLRDALLAFRKKTGKWPAGAEELKLFAGENPSGFRPDDYETLHVSGTNWGNYELEAFFSRKKGKEGAGGPDKFSVGRLYVKQGGAWRFYSLSKTAGHLGKLDGKEKELIGRRLAEIPNLLAEWQEVEYDPATGEAKFHYEIFFAEHLKLTVKAGRILDAYQYSTLDMGPREPE